jgi:hypothetical protein
MTHLA